MPLLLGGLAGALAFAGILGFAVVKFGSLSSLTHIRRRSESIWDAVDTGHLPPWQQPNSDIRPPHLRDPLRARREIESLLGHRCHLELFVKVEEDWRNKDALLDEFGLN